MDINPSVLLNLVDQKEAEGMVIYEAKDCESQLHKRNFNIGALLRS